MSGLASVVIDRTSLSLGTLTIASDFGTGEFSGGYYLDAAGLGRPGRTPRETIATASPFINGQTRTAVVWDESTLPLTVRVEADTTVHLNTLVSSLEDALSQFVYPVAVTVDGITKTYTAYPATWNSTDALLNVTRVRGYFEDLAISIPVYPLSS